LIDYVSLFLLLICIKNAIINKTVALINFFFLDPINSYINVSAAVFTTLDCYAINKIYVYKVNKISSY